MRSRLFIAILILIPAFIGSGCASGFIYTNVTRPLSTDMDKTPCGAVVARIGSKQLQEPITGLGISAEWDSRAIGDAARKAGMETFYLADMHTVSILGGLWKQQTVLVRGE